MTTAHSPLRVLKVQADGIASMLKAAERGEDLGVRDAAGRIAAARKQDAVKFAVVMDDKMLSIEMRWDAIRGMSEAAISAYILKHMREEREH